MAPSDDPTRSTPASDTTVSVQWASGPRLEVVIPASVGHVDLGREIGRGGMGVVFEGWDSVLHRKVAVKFLLGAAATPEDPHFAQFLKGARAEAALRHPHIVAVHTAGVVENVPYMVMDFIDGPTLRAVSRKTGPMPLAAALRIAWDVVSAVEALHERDLIHRDLKPGNVMFDHDGRLYVTDFGLASLRRRGASGLSMGGTPAYMAPETFAGRASAQSDVYALGVMLFELLSGKLPFAGDSEELPRQHAEAPLPVDRLPDGVPESVVEILLRATHKREVFRYKTAGHLRRALEDGPVTPALLRNGDVAVKTLTASAVADPAAGDPGTSSPSTPTSSYFDRIAELAEQKREATGAPMPALRTEPAPRRAPAPADARDRPSWWRVLAAPWVEWRHPSRAARLMVRASRAAFCISFLVATGVTATATVGIQLWDATYTIRYVRAGTKKGPDGRFLYTLAVQEASASELWQRWHVNGWYGVAERQFVAFTITVAVLAALAGLLYLPQVHVAESAWRSYERALRAVGSGAGVFAVTQGLAGVASLLAGDYWGASWASRGLVETWAYVGSISIVSIWIGAGARSVRDDAPPIDLPPRCEGCGYDLRHLKLDGRCPECGLAVASSLAPHARRTGCAWENRRGPVGWLVSSFQALIHPQRFYGSLVMLRPDGRFRGFAPWHYAAVGGGSGLCFLVAAAKDLPWTEAIVFACTPPPVIAFVAWLAHRGVVTFAAGGWIIDKMLPDFRWARRVIEYEAVFAWAFLFFNVLLVVLDHLLREYFRAQGLRAPVGAFSDLAAVLGNGALLVFWMRRYQTAVRAVRWSNF